MKKIVLINLCALTLIFLTAGVSARPNTDRETIQTLMEQRINVLNYYYGGKMNLEDARCNVEKLTANTLLKEDVRMMKAFDGEAVDQVAAFDIELVSCSRTSYGIIKGQADIYWLMQGENGRWETEESYFFTAEDHQGEVKITQLKKI